MTLRHLGRIAQARPSASGAQDIERSKELGPGLGALGTCVRAAALRNVSTLMHAGTLLPVPGNKPTR